MRNALARTTFALQKTLTVRLATVFAACTFALLLSPSRASAQASTNLGSVQLSVLNPAPTGTTKYVSVYVSITQGATTTGDWFELPYVTAGPNGPGPKITFSDTGGAPLTLSDVGFLTSPTLIPLDNLNFNDYPPPGSPGSTYNPLPSLDSTLNPGGSESAVAPDSSWTMALLLGTMALLVAARQQLQGLKLCQCKANIQPR